MLTLKVIRMSDIAYEELLASFRKGLRNGNWKKLNFLNKALYRASLWYAKHRESIVNTSLMVKLLGLVERLKETKGMRIFKRGFKKRLNCSRRVKKEAYLHGLRS